MDRTLLIGLDGATFTVLDALIADGVMPFLGELIARGARARLLSTPNPLTPPAWTSAVTGRTPGHHGIFDFVRAAEGDGGLFVTLNTALDVRCETLWSMVSRHGGRVTVLNFPLSSPPPPVMGCVVPGFVPWKHLRRAVHPPELWETLTAVPGFDPRELAMDLTEELRSIQWLPEDRYEAWIVQHVRRERQWFAVARELLIRQPADLVAILFDGVDKLQHLCWRFLDPDLAADLDAAGRRVRARCLQYFRELDGFLRELAGLAGPTSRLFVVSDHGFGPTRDVFYANVWLARRGDLAWSEGLPPDELGRIAADRIRSHVVGIDWRRTVAYALTPSSNGIFIRRAERPGAPGVPPDAYEAFRRRLADELVALRHPRTGRPVVRRVLTREEAFPGPANERAPDLTLVLEDYGFLSVLNADDFVKPRPMPAGTHRPDGIFIAAGAGIAPGRVLPEASIVDVAPTVLYSLGLPIPTDLEGRAVTGCFEERLLATRPVRVGAPTAGPAAAPVGSGAVPHEEERGVFARLQELGYLE